MAQRSFGYFSRLRFLYNRKLTVANLLDRACQGHDLSAQPLRLLEPLPHLRLAGLAISYRQLLDFVNRLGNVLREQAGLKRYDRVAIFKSDAPDYIIMSLAIIKAGGISVPINGGMSLDGLQHYLKQTGARILITDQETYTQTIKDPDSLSMVDTWLFPVAPEGFTAPHVDLNHTMERVSDQLEPVELCKDSHALIVHTSGTTGAPKGVLHTSETTLRSMRLLCISLPGPRKRRRQLYLWPNNHLITHHTGFVALLANLPTWFVHRHTDIDTVLGLVEREQIAEFAAFPEVYTKIDEAGWDKYKLESIRFWFSAADAAHESYIRKCTQKGALVRLFGRPVIRSVFLESLGSSEINGPAVLRFIFSFSKRYDRFVGRRFPMGPRVKVGDENGRALPAGQVGRFMVKGPGLFKGYWNAHDRLHGVFFDGWWWSGDVVYRDRWGRYYQLDRQTDVVETPKGAVYTLPIEEVVLKHPAVFETAVIGVEQPTGEMAPIALVCPRPKTKLDPAECLAWVNERLGHNGPLHSVKVVSYHELKRGLTGKVLKRALRERFAPQTP